MLNTIRDQSDSQKPGKNSLTGSLMGVRFVESTQKQLAFGASGGTVTYKMPIKGGVHNARSYNKSINRGCVLICMAEQVTMYPNTKGWDRALRARQMNPDICTNLQTQKLQNHIPQLLDI